MARTIDLTGQVFGRLTVVSEGGRGERGRVLWNCECVCGNTIVVRADSLKSGQTSCGCFRKEVVKDTNTKHGLRKHPLYQVWANMKDRCYNIKCKYYPNYGSRGITICDRWKDSFENFYNDVVEGYEEGLQLDRIDNDGNYEPNNVRWVKSQQNSMNRGGHKNTSSRYKGVSWNKKINKWVAQIQKDGKKHHLGSFSNEHEAAVAYNKKAKEFFVEYAYLNKIEENKSGGNSV